jgi:O-antigen/teichoic acid export membrane protein
MSLRRNILASYTSQACVAVVGIAALPFYLRYLGAEAYGLAGFFAMLQAWFMLLDVGLTPTLARETARHHAQAIDADDYASLVRVLRLFFVAMAVGGGGLLWAASGLVAEHWLQVQQLPTHEVSDALRIMAVIVALRWMCGLYRSIVTGAEHIVWLSGFNAGIAVVRTVGVLAALHWVAPTAAVFFGFQLAVAVVELALLAREAHRLLPANAQRRPLREAVAAVKPLLRFALSVAFTASLWIVVTQSDKLLLSKILPLSDYGYFTLAVLVAGAVLLISGPVSAALLPHLARLEAQHNRTALIDTYRRSTQFVVVAALATAFAVALCAQPLLLAWSDDATLADRTAPVLALYALGNGILAVSSFPYYLQYAKGRLRLHVVGSVLFVALLVPAMAWAAAVHGGEGAGWVWMAVNAAYLLGWAPLIHRRLLAGINRSWFLRDIGAIAVPMAAAAAVLARMLLESDPAWLVFLKVGLVLGGAAALGASLTSTGLGRWRALLRRQHVVAGGGVG